MKSTKLVLLLIGIVSFVVIIIKALTSQPSDTTMMIAGLVCSTCLMYGAVADTNLNKTPEK